MKEWQSYSQYGYWIKKLTKQIQDSGIIKEKGITQVHGIARGGLPIAVHLSHNLNLKMADVLPINDAILIVDDIADTGKTLKNAKLLIPNAVTATLYYKPHSIFKPDFYALETDKWIIFAWETPKSTKREV